MKIRYCSLLIVFAMLLYGQDVNASHQQGGEITWECISSGPNTGKLIFKLTRYALCYGCLPSTKTINNPLYPSYGGPSVIPMPFITYRSLNNENCYDSSQVFQCYFGVNDIFAFIEEVNESLPIQLNGIPNANGSSFFWSTCCRPTSWNTLGSSYYFRSIMFPYTEPGNSTPNSLGSNENGPTCYDSSPILAAKPQSIVCGKTDVKYSVQRIDLESDSMHYNWSTPLQFATNSVLYKTGYSLKLPLPNLYQDSSNIPPVLDTNNGFISFKTFSPLLTTPGYFVVCTKNSSYRNGQKVAEVYREMTLNIIDCDTGNGTLTNNGPPVLEIKEASSVNYQTSYHRTFQVGSQIELDIKSVDVGTLPTSPVSFQSVDMNVSGVSMSSIPNDSLSCQYGPCAYLDSVNSAWNGTKFLQPNFVITRFTWNTSCQNLDDGTNYGGTVSKTFHFYVSSSDNYCPVSGLSDMIFTITLIDTMQAKWPIDTLDASQGGVNVSWPVYGGSNFGSYQIYKKPLSLNPWAFLTNITNQSTRSYFDAGATSQANSIYYNVKLSSKSGCTNGFDVRTIKLDAVKNGYFVDLSWNMPYSDSLRRMNTYYIQQLDTLGPWITIDSILNGQVNYIDTTPPKNQPIYYKILSKDKYDFVAISSLASTYVDTIIVQPPPPPPPAFGSGTPPKIGPPADGHHSFVGINKEERSTFRVYPNPIRNEMTIEVDEQFGPYSAELLNIQGERVQSFQINTDRYTMNATDLESGLYFLNMKDASGKTEILKVIKSSR